MMNSFASVSRTGVPPQKFGDVFGRTKIHFNHMIRPFQHAVLTRQNLLAMIARGAAAFGATGQPGFDMVFLFLYDTNDLDNEKVGATLVQGKNHVGTLTAKDIFFQLMDPYYCSLLEKTQDLDIDVPIIRIVFSFGDKKPGLKHHTYTSPENGALILNDDGQPRFTSYDFWCSGIGPKLLQPVDEGSSLTKWRTLLGKLSKWDGLFQKAPRVRRSQYPAGGTNPGHFRAWFSDE